MPSSIPLAGQSLSELNPELAQDWHPTKNNDLLPHNVKISSGKKVWWRAKECGHEWYSTISHRSNGSGCPYCQGKKLLIGFNDLLTKFPELCREWHPRNLYSPYEIIQSSKDSAWWICERNHEWKAVIRNRSFNNVGCPYCKNRAVLVGFNDLESSYLELAKEWHPTKNIKTPENVTSGSGYRATWLGSCGHEWKAKVCDRVTYKTSCPKCSSNVSSQERQIIKFLETRFPKIEIVTNSRKILDGLEIDIYLPQYQIAMEINGLYWHSEKFKTKTYHLDKWNLCKDKDIYLIYLWEDDLNERFSALQDQIYAILLNPASLIKSSPLKVPVGSFESAAYQILNFEVSVKYDCDYTFFSRQKRLPKAEGNDNFLKIWDAGFVLFEESS